MGNTGGPQALRPSGRVALEGRIGSGWEGVFRSRERHIIVQNSVTAVCRDEKS